MDEKENTGNKFRKNRKLIIRAIIIALILFFMIFSDYGFLTTLRLWWNIGDLKEKITEQQKLNDSLKVRVKVLTSDSTELERLARENYGMIKHGERVYIILEK